ncbi:MAG: hypothetical protein C0404_00195 [Verrucomicrobia bacterium]|nr:hypothetical protein [Verrucomicrobiota bacterium]
MMMSGVPQNRGKVHVIALVLVCLAAFYLRMQGVAWPQFHPDEPKIASWIEWTYGHRYVEERVYANGFFVMLKPFEKALKVWYKAGSIADYVAGRTATVARVHLFDKLEPVMVARWFNVWIGMLTCVVIYWLTVRVTGSKWIGVFSAGLLAAAQYPVEHAHYGESDVAMLFTLAVSLWLLTLAADRPGLPALLLAAVVSGFAFGTKFQLVILLVPLAVYCACLVGWPVTAKGAGRGTRALVLALVFFAAGFSTANQYVFNWTWFVNGVTHEMGRVYNEPGVAAAKIKWLAHGKELLQYGSTLGAGWLLLAAAGIPIALTRRYRRYAPVLVLLPALYLYYWFFAAPWVRSQEFMCFIPPLAVLSGLTLAALWKLERPFIRLGAVVLACLSLALTTFNGMAVMSIFAWKDTRVLAREWMQQRIPRGSVIAAEHYSEPALPDTGKEPVAAYKIEREGLFHVRSADGKYLLRTATIDGRGLRDPITGKLRPEFQAKFDKFARNSELLASFATLPPAGAATFVSPTIELYGLERFNSTNLLNVELSQPFYTSPSSRTGDMQPTIFRIGHRLGGSTAVELSRTPTTIGIGGPGAGPAEIYVVLSSRESAARARIKGLGRILTTSLGPYDAKVLRITRFRFHASPDRFDKLTVSLLAGARQGRSGCFVRVAFSRGEAAGMCADMNRHDLVSYVLAQGDPQDALDPVLHYIHLVETRQWTEAGRARPAAESAAEFVKRCAAAAPAGVRINGNSGHFYNQFARIALPGEISFRLDNRQNPGTPDAQPSPLQARMWLPFSTAKGNYDFRGEVTFEPKGNDTNSPATVEFFTGTDESCMARVDCRSGASELFTVNVTASASAEPRLIIATRTPGVIHLNNMELRWSLKSALSARHVELMAAMAKHDAHQGNSKEALDNLAELAKLDRPWNLLDIHRTRFSILETSAVTNMEFRSAALHLMRCAPNNNGCLDAIAAFSGQQLGRPFVSNLESPLTFGRFLSLVSFSYDQAGRKVRCVFEATEDDVPLLYVSLGSHDGRARQLVAINNGVQLTKGERIVVSAVLEESECASANPGDLSIGVQTCRDAALGAIPLAGRAGNSVPFTFLQKLVK